MRFSALACLMMAAIFLTPGASHGQEAQAPFTDADQLPTPNDGKKYFRPDAVPPYPVRHPTGTLVDLHTHVFQHGLGIISPGSFTDSSLSAKWDSRLGNNINDEQRFPASKKLLAFVFLQPAENYLIA